MSNEVSMPILKSITTDLGSQKVETRPQINILNKLESNNDSVEKPTNNQGADNSISNEELDSVVTEMNSVAQNLQRDLMFSVDEKSGGTFVKVIDKETEEVVREIPSKEIREIKARLEEVSGMIFNKSI